MHVEVKASLRGLSSKCDERGMCARSVFDLVQDRLECLVADEDEECGFGLAPREVAERLGECRAVVFCAVPELTLCREQDAAIMAEQDVGFPGPVLGLSGHVGVVRSERHGELVPEVFLTLPTICLP